MNHFSYIVRFDKFFWFVWIFLGISTQKKFYFNLQYIQKRQGSFCMVIWIEGRFLCVPQYISYISMEVGSSNFQPIYIQILILFNIIQSSFRSIVCFMLLHKWVNISDFSVDSQKSMLEFNTFTTGTQILDLIFFGLLRAKTKKERK